ncbi:MAG: hypothetical protein ABIS35_14355 [Terracoccus sp.]
MSRSGSEPFRLSLTGAARATSWGRRRGRVRRLFQDVYVEAGAPITPAVLARGALLIAAPGSYVSHHTAARLWGGVVPDTDRTDVTSTKVRLRTTGILGHRVRGADQVTRLDGIPLTTPIKTFLDLGLYLDLVDLVVLGDSLVKKKRMTVPQLVRAADLARGPGSRRAREAAGFVRAGVDSPMESRLRMLIVLAGLPEPVVNHRIRRVDGSVRWRFDLCFPDVRLIIEYDGRQHADSDEQWHGDIGRREWMDENSWRIVVVVSNDLYRTPALTLSRITAAMRARGMVLPRLREDWRRYFPSRSEDLAHPA